MLTHKGTQTIETPRLILRPFTMADAEPMFRNWASDPEVCRHMTWPTHASVDVTRELLTRWTESYCNPDYYNWAIVIKDNGPEPIGNISAAHIREKTRCAHIGYCMSRAHWGKGIMTEALTALTDFFFDQVGCNRIEAEHDPNNPASGRVMEKAGMTYEGTSRQAAVSNQGIIDVSRWAILKCDREEKR
ncbi:MAG: GNAT family N-acetyltransferase [Ruminococcaceae bacterium]|nr:GNAT family N-acetyltransferase [Oscillospiraceae bacterium]